MSIINKPELRPPKQKIIETLFIAAGTIVIHTVLLGATLALWGFSLGYFWDRLFTPAILDGTIKMATFLAVFALATYFIVVAWAKYNLFVYGRRNRRKPLPPATDDMLAGMYNTDVRCIEAARRCKAGTVEVVGDQLVFCGNELCFRVKEAGVE